MTTRDQIKSWLERNLEENPTHMIVVCDTFSYEDYPVYVTKGENVREVAKRYNEKDMQKIMEVYSYNLDLEDQLNEGRAFHFN